MTSPTTSPATARTTRTRGTLELIAAMILSGTIGVFVVESGAEPATAAWFRCVIGAVAMGAYCLARGYLLTSGYTARLLLVAVGGGLALVANWVFLFASYQNTSIGIATVAYHVQPFLLILAAPIVLRERITARQGAWVALGFAGLVLVAQPWSEPLTGQFMIGMAQAVTAAALYAAATIIAKRLTGVRPHITVLIQTGVGAVVLVPFVAWAGVGGTWSQGWAWLIGLGVIHTGIMYLLMYSAYPKVPTPVIAVLGFVYPVVALIVDLIVYGTALTLAQVLGIAVILAAGIANTIPPRRPSAPTSQAEACRNEAR